MCCHDALALAGRLYTVDELVREIETDRPYYRIGEGGGITLTGGEPMQQPGFLASLLERLEGIHVCVETCGHVPSENFLMRWRPGSTSSCSTTRRPIPGAIGACAASRTG